MDGGVVLREVVERVQAGDESAIHALRKLMDDFPEAASAVFDAAWSVERSIVREMAGGNLIVEEAVPRTLKAMRKELAGEDPSPLENLLVERIVVCWLQLQYFDVLYTRSMKNSSAAQSEHHQKLIDRAHRRYLSAVKTLAQIRKMGPNVQINIAEQQVNTAS